MQQRSKRYTHCLAVLCAAICLTACGGTDSTVTQDQMPYGATITTNASAYPMAMQYDNRFLEDALIARLADYYDAIQTQDAARYAAVQLPLYHDYELTTLMGGEYTDDDIVKMVYSGLAEYNGGAFEFAMVEITDAKRGTVYSDTAALIEILDTLSTETSGTQISQNIDNAYELTVRRYLTNAGSGVRRETNTIVEEESLFALHWNGTWYFILS